jgi:hypothetical protein
MILVCNLGKFRLFKGQPLLASCWLEPEWSDYAAGGSIRGGRLLTNEKPAVLARNCGSGANVALRQIEDNVPPGVAAADTSAMPEGAYEILIALNAKEMWIPEAVWILGRESYRELLVDESREEFAQAPSISTGAELRSAVQQIVHSAWSEPRLRIETSFSSAVPIPLSRIDWIMRTILDTFQYIAVFGVKGGTAFAAIHDEKAEIGIQADLEYAPPSAVLSSLRDEKVSDLYLLNAHGDLVDFDVDLSVEGLVARIAIRQSMPQLITV